jgi:hypothetical protein
MITTIELFKINQDKQSELSNYLTIENFKNLDFLSGKYKSIENLTEKINSKDFSFSIDLNEYMEIVSKEKFTKDANKKLSVKLYLDLLSAGLPNNIFYLNEFWAYINLFVFPKLIKTLYFDKPDESEEPSNKLKLLEKYRRYYLNNVPISNISRTGLWFLWVLASKVNPTLNPDLIPLAFDFIDPVKAMIERSQGKNSQVLIAWLKAISKLDMKYQKLLKSEKFRSIIPTHLNNLSVIFSLESLDDEMIIQTITNETKEFIDTQN